MSTTAAPPRTACGTSARDALQRQVVPDVLAGRKIAALAITEPGAGSDVARLACRARRDGVDWVIDGEKAFITSGLRADWLTVAVRTGGPGAGGISLIAVPGDAAGLERFGSRLLDRQRAQLLAGRARGCEDAHVLVAALPEQAPRDLADGACRADHTDACVSH